MSDSVLNTLVDRADGGKDRFEITGVVPRILALHMPHDCESVATGMVLLASGH